MALGGVATGNIKAQDAPKPMMSESPNGLSPIFSATEMKIGTNSAALAVLLVNSVRKMIKLTTTTQMTK